MRFVLIELRKMLYAHPKVNADSARVRIVLFGPYSLDLEVFTYIDVMDVGEFLEIAEDLNLRIMDLVAQAGTGFASPRRLRISRKAKTWTRSARAMRSAASLSGAKTMRLFLQGVSRRRGSTNSTTRSTIRRAVRRRWEWRRSLRCHRRHTRRSG